MADLTGFDADKIEPSHHFDPLPVGKYLAVIIDSEFTPNKAATGHYLLLTVQIIDGQYKGRLLWARLNLDNPSAKAVQIANEELSAICRAVGVLQPKDSTELHDLPLQIKVKIVKRNDTGELTNEIGGYTKITPPNGTPPTPPDGTPPTAPNSTPPTAPDGTPPTALDGTPPTALDGTPPTAPDNTPPWKRP